MKTTNKIQHKSGKTDSVVVIVIAITVIILAIIMFFGSKSSTTPEIIKDTNIELSVDLKTFDWGDIDIEGGVVNKTFEVKNDSDQVLKLFNIKTSCMCTTAQVIVGDKKSKKFGMHEKTSIVVEVPARATAKILVEFDPAFHGPDAVGAITRAITMDTNSSDNPNLVFELTGNVFKK